MKSTNHFKQTILKYLEDRAKNDELFAVTFKKENKNIDDCITYILNTVQKSGSNGFTNDEVYSMAVHYYDEDNIEVGKEIDNCNIVVNHTVELTEEEKEEAKKKAMDEAVEQARKKIMNKPVQKKQITTETQIDLFS